jgi:hypothetical protein
MFHRGLEETHMAATTRPSDEGPNADAIVDETTLRFISVRAAMMRAPLPHASAITTPGVPDPSVGGSRPNRSRNDRSNLPRTHLTFAIDPPSF